MALEVHHLFSPFLTRCQCFAHFEGGRSVLEFGHNSISTRRIDVGASEPGTIFASRLGSYPPDASASMSKAAWRVHKVHVLSTTGASVSLRVANMHMFKNMPKLHCTSYRNRQFGGIKCSEKH